jgi:hypothetical protein
MKTEKTKYAEIVAWDVIHEKNKSVARKIQIIREISPDEWDHLGGQFETHFGTYYYHHRKLHRDDGPAITLANGHKEWYSSGLLYHGDGPDRELANGYK